MDITLHASVHDHVASNDVGRQLCCSPDRNFRSSIWTSPSSIPSMSRSSLPEISPLKMQARSEPRRRKARCPSRTRHILVHLSWSLPKRRNGFWRIRLQTCRFWVRSLRCIRFLFTPHRNLPRDDAAQLTNGVDAACFRSHLWLADMRL